MKRGIAPSSLIGSCRSGPRPATRWTSLTALDGGEGQLRSPARRAPISDGSCSCRHCPGARGQPVAGRRRVSAHGADFDSDPADWTSALCRARRRPLDSVMGHCQGSRGAAIRPRLPRYSSATTCRRASPLPDTAASGSRRCARRSGSSEPSGTGHAGPGGGIGGARRCERPGPRWSADDARRLAGQRDLSASAPSFARFLFARSPIGGWRAVFCRTSAGGSRSTSSGRRSRPGHTLNIAFTYAGMLSLGVPAESFEGLDAFMQGMAARAARSATRRVRARALGARPRRLTCRVHPDRCGSGRR